jgi:peptidoglycan/LPS O-acetylase OafA/YrhL
MSKWGKYTYGLYLLHPIASIFGVIVFKRIFGTPESFWPSLSEGLFIFVITCAMAWLSFHYFEMFFLKFKKNFSYISKE